MHVSSTPNDVEAFHLDALVQGWDDAHGLRVAVASRMVAAGWIVRRYLPGEGPYGRTTPHWELTAAGYRAVGARVPDGHVDPVLSHLSSP